MLVQMHAHSVAMRSVSLGLLESVGMPSYSAKIEGAGLCKDIKLRMCDFEVAGIIFVLFDLFVSCGCLRERVGGCKKLSICEIGA